jgi:hypothetical protein
MSKIVEKETQASAIYWGHLKVPFEDGERESSLRNVVLK